MYADEIIADSEGEDELFGLFRAVDVGPQTTTTNVSAASTSVNESTISELPTSKATAGDTISDFSSIAPIPNAQAVSTSTIINTAIASSSRPRPKPRPLPRAVHATAGGGVSDKTSSSISNIETFDMTLSIADRAKMRKRNSDIQSSSFPAAPAPAYSHDIIELSSDDDELVLRPAKKPTKPKKKTKEKMTVSGKKAAALKEPSDPDIPLSFALPTVDTSPVIARRNRFSPMLLPPSDPPQSTPSEDFYGIPAIETLPNPSSSATSVSVSAFPADKTHMDSDLDLDMPPPPAPFFADPSSSPFQIDHDTHNTADDFDTANAHTTRKFVDSVMMPPPPVPSLPPILLQGAEVAKKPRAKKKRANDDEDDFVLDAENRADDKMKGKGKKGKSKGKDKAQNQSATSKGNISKPSTKTKGKRKKKEMVDTSAQSTFKSREIMVDDVEGDIDEMLMSTITIPPRNTTTTTSDNGPPAPRAQPQHSSPAIKRTRKSWDVQEDDIGEEDEEQRQAARKKSRRSDGDDAYAAAAIARVDKVGSDLNLGTYSRDMNGVDVDLGTSPLHKSGGRKGKRTRVIMSDDEDGDEVVDAVLSRVEPPKTKSKTTKSKPKPKSTSNATKRVVIEDEEHEIAAVNEIEPKSSSKENITPILPGVPQTPIPQAGSSKLTTPATDQKQLKYPTLASRYTIAPKSARKSTPMSDLIRRVNSMPNSQFKSPVPKRRSSDGGDRGTTPSTTHSTGEGGGLTAYSPYLKSSRSFLSKIAPLHPNRRTPPPLPPAPPPRKKTRKEIEWEKKDKEEREEMEERWEEELVERVGGIGEWLGLGEEMRKVMKRAKRDRELGLGGWEE